MIEPALAPASDFPLNVLVIMGAVWRAVGLRAFSSGRGPYRSAAGGIRGALVLAAVASAAAALCACSPLVRAHGEPTVVNGPCVPSGTWLVPATRESLSTPAVIDRAAAARIVLLGEEHDRPEHHLWELQNIAALHGRRQQLVIGLEMFPRSAQRVLDEWVAGTLDEPHFLAESGWNDFWRMSPELYLPILRFARLNHVRLLALNVSRALTAEVAENGWDQVLPGRREGVSQPAAAAPAYEKLLAESYQQHFEKTHPPHHGDASGFVAAQLLWDRAFAEALRTAAETQPDALVIGIMGSGHLEHRYGVPHQLAALGVTDVIVLLPWTASHDCTDLTPDLADAVFGIEPAAAFEQGRPVLGVGIEATKRGVIVRQVSKRSVAGAAGIRKGDLIVEAAGVAVHTPGDLQEIVTRQAPGTWLPLRVQRGRKQLKIVARFPARR